MTPEEAIEIIHEKHMDMEYYFAEHDRYPKYYNFEFDQATLIAAQACKEIQQYREMERKLEEAYGKCDGLLEVVVDNLYLHKGRDIGKPRKATLLTDDSVDMWEAYKQIGTVEECREAVEKLKRAEEALNVILSGNYNDECNFCVHNDNPMANCQCICGDGSWCIHNAKWNGKTSEDENLEGMEDEGKAI